MRYKTSRALEQAVKAAAKKSGRDVNRAIADFYHDRLLERVFSEKNPAFVLKGGRGMLARTLSARYTKDTDMAFEGSSIDEAIAELKRVASIDLADHLEYRYISDSPIIEEQEYREGCRVIFEAVLGGTKKVANVSIDLVVSDVPLERTDLMTPAARLHIEGLPCYDYRVYPVEEAISDKVCATMSTYRGMPSSRVRDLVDLVIYLTTETIDGEVLARCLKRELRMGHMGEMRPFSVPESWKSDFAPTYRGLAKQCGLSDSLWSVENAEHLVATCIDAALYDNLNSKQWNCETLGWEELGPLKAIKL